MSANIAVIGAGAWGIALAIQASRTGANVFLWSRRELPDPKKRTLSRLPCVPLPSSIQVCNQMPDKADLVLLCVPMQYLRSVLPDVPQKAPLIICCKGVEQDTLNFPMEILQEIRPSQIHAVLSGPNFANEVAIGLPAASVLASKDATQAREIADLLTTSQFRLYTNTDPIGVQIGGAAKNVFAIAAGAVMGAGLGENARAALITRGITELARLSNGLGGMTETLSGLAGLGDLILTCTGEGSRNYSLGLELGRGMTLDEILKKRTTVAEGVATAPALLKRAQKHHVNTPIIQMVSALLSNQITIKEAAKALLSRPVGME
ncbi:MAG: NAD(P)-dependent glycerol-3-phosphate dehydrogenase [Commensalibacter sp.]|nr:NAD(P)-dependent glycerol-3-phosphate dehydrogenase [Commensalibacter sp.]